MSLRSRLEELVPKSSFLSRLTSEDDLADFWRRSREAPPREAFEAAAGFIYMLALQILRSEIREDRIAIVSDFEEAAGSLVRAARKGATVQQQARVLRKAWKRLRLPERDLRKRRLQRGPSDQALAREVEALRSSLMPLLQNRKKRASHRELQRELRKIVPSATPKTIRDAASEGPMTAAWMLIGAQYHLGWRTVRNRVSRAAPRP